MKGSMMVLTAAVAFALMFVAPATATFCGSMYEQCGGLGWSGKTCCRAGSFCIKSNDYYSQCRPCDIVGADNACKCTTAPNTVVNNDGNRCVPPCSIPGQISTSHDGGNCQCPAGQKVIGGKCAVPPTCAIVGADAECKCSTAPNTVVNNDGNRCVPPCPIPGQISTSHDGGNCQCPTGQKVIGNKCAVPPTCAITNADADCKCTIAPNTQLNSDRNRCVPPCPIQGQTTTNHYGRNCRCPTGQVVIGNKCDVPPPVCDIGGADKDCKCPAGTVVTTNTDGSKHCKPCLAGSSPNGGVCVCNNGEKYDSTSGCPAPPPVCNIGGADKDCKCPAGTVVTTNTDGSKHCKPCLAGATPKDGVCACDNGVTYDSKMGCPAPTPKCKDNEITFGTGAEQGCWPCKDGSKPDAAGTNCVCPTGGAYDWKTERCPGTGPPVCQGDEISYGSGSTAGCWPCKDGAHADAAGTNCACKNGKTYVWATETCTGGGPPKCTPEEISYGSGSTAGCWPCKDGAHADAAGTNCVCKIGKYDWSKEMCVADTCNIADANAACKCDGDKPQINSDGNRCLPACPIPGQLPVGHFGEQGCK